MARATNDVQQLIVMINPGIGLIVPSFFTLVVAIARHRPALAGVLPRRCSSSSASCLLAAALHAPSSGRSPARCGRSSATMNADLAEAIGGIEVVKAYAQEPAERDTLRRERARATATCSSSRA